MANTDVNELKRVAETIDWSKVPAYNIVDFENDDLNVIRSKLEKVTEDDVETFTPTKQLGPGLNNVTGNKFEDPDEPLESFEQCKHLNDNFTSDDYPGIDHHCIYQDIYGRCTKDTCVFDGQEGPKIAHKLWKECIICGNKISLPPNMFDVAICDLCRGRMRFAEQLPFTCLLCGKKQSRPSKAMFSQICDKCWKENIANDNCRHWRKIKNSPAKGYDKL